MELMLNEICEEINNYFDTKRLFGTFSISDGSITIDDITDEQYFRIIGSKFNDGIYKYPTIELIDEEFDGAVWLMAVPNTVISLSDNIEQWQEEYKKDLESPYQSESFGQYSYTLKGGESGASWRNVFSDKLKRWRKMLPY